MDREALEARIALARQQWAGAQQRQQAAYEERLRIEGYIAHCQELLAEMGRGEATPPAPPGEVS